MPKPKERIDYFGLPAGTAPVCPLEPTSATTHHFGSAPVGRVHRRHKQGCVQLTNGNLVLDHPVPPELILSLRKSDNETGSARYTAATCDPDDFENRGFFLRQNESNRSTELLICVTMYDVLPSFALDLHDLTQL